MDGKRMRKVSIVQWALDGHSSALKDVGIDHGGAEVLVTEEFLDGANVIPILEEVGGEGVAEGVATDAFLNAGFAGSRFDSALQTGGIQVVTTLFSAARIERASGSGKEVLPDQFTSSVGVFYFEGVGEVDFAETGLQVLFVEKPGALDLTAEVGEDGIGHGGDAVLFPFAIADSDGLVFEINILDAQAEAIHEAQAGAVEKLGHEFMRASEQVDDAQDFIAGQNSGEAFGAFGAGEKDGFDLLVEDFTVEEEDGAESLILGGGGNVPLSCEVGKEGSDFGGAHLCRVAFVMEEDVAFGPIQVGFFGAVGVMFEANDIAHTFDKLSAGLVEYFFCHRRLTFLGRSV